MTIELNGTTGITSPNLTGNGSGLTSLTSANLTGSLPAIDGSALTGVGASTTFGAVGTYILGYRNTISPSALSPGDTMAGSLLYNANLALYVDGTHSGTWRIMGALPNSSGNAIRTTVWLRIS